MSDGREPIEVPAGMMRVWDPAQKKVIFVQAATAGPDRIIFTMRLHDHAEKKHADLSSSWVTIDVDRRDLSMEKADFIAKYVEPHLSDLKQLTLR